MLITVLIIFGFIAWIFMMYHRTRHHDSRLWKTWYVTANVLIIFGCIFQFLLALSQGNSGEAKVDLLFAFILVISAWVECTR